MQSLPIKQKQKALIVPIQIMFLFGQQTLSKVLFSFNNFKPILVSISLQHSDSPKKIPGPEDNIRNAD